MMFRRVVAILSLIFLSFSAASTTPKATADPPAVTGIRMGPELLSVGSALADARVRYPGVYSLSRALSETAVEVEYKKDQPAAKDFMDFVEKSSLNGAVITWVATYYSLEDIDDLTSQVMALTVDKGITFNGGSFNAEKHSFVVNTTAAEFARYGNAEIASLNVNKTPIVVKLEMAEAKIEARYSDGGIWEGGLALNVGTPPPVGQAYCTGGYTWKKKGTGILYGSTAEHCAWLDNNHDGDDTDPGDLTYTKFYNGTNPVGTRQFTCPAFNRRCDTMLLKKSNSANSWSNTVWWGDENTASYRRVTSVQEPMINTWVWKSGANSGLTSSWITNTHRVNTWGGRTIEVYQYVSTGGDSGSPWGIPTANNSVTAVGQHWGAWCYDGKWVSGVCTGTARSNYNPAVDIGIALDAWIYTGS